MADPPLAPGGNTFFSLKHTSVDDLLTPSRIAGVIQGRLRDDAQRMIEKGLNSDCWRVGRESGKLGSVDELQWTVSSHDEEMGTVSWTCPLLGCSSGSVLVYAPVARQGCRSIWGHINHRQHQVCALFFDLCSRHLFCFVE